MFTYTKMKDGTYQFGGLGKEILEDAQEFFNMRFGIKKLSYYSVCFINEIKQLLLFFCHNEYSIRYTVLDPVEVAKYGIWGAIYGPLIKKVIGTIYL